MIKKYVQQIVDYYQLQLGSNRLYYTNNKSTLLHLSDINKIRAS